MCKDSSQNKIAKQKHYREVEAKLMVVLFMCLRSKVA